MQTKRDKEIKQIVKIMGNQQTIFEALMESFNTFEITNATDTETLLKDLLQSDYHFCNYLTVLSNLSEKYGL